MMKNFRYLLIPVIAILTAFPALADGNSDDGSDPGDEINILPDQPKDDRRTRMPRRDNSLQIHYSAGLLICADWPETDDTLHIRIYGTDGAILFETMCLPSNLANGIYIGHFGSFMLSITTSSGASYTGFH